MVITIIMIEMEHLLKVYKMVAGAKINWGKSVGLQLGTWREKLMPLNGGLG